jgi:hypothetical protein
MQVNFEVRTSISCFFAAADGKQTCGGRQKGNEIR